MMPQHEVLVIGAGFGGLGAAIALRRAGIEDFRILEKRDGIGGTWYSHRYPGLTVDIPTLYYSFSYEPPRRWTRVFSPGGEVRAYADQLADRYQLRSRIILNSHVNHCEWDETDRMWRVVLANGDTMTARFVIAAYGALERPKMPEIPGIYDFGGTLVHTASWDDQCSSAGKRIAVIGTGASAIQIIPELADVADRLTVYQRHPIWALPKPDFAIPPWLAATLLRVSVIRRLLRMCLSLWNDTANIYPMHYRRLGPLGPWVSRVIGRLQRRRLRDRPGLADRLTPDYPLACKRISVSNRYLPTFRLPHVELVTEPIQEITETGIITADGEHRESDLIVCATGYRTGEKGASTPYPIIGRDGVELGAFWDENRFQAYQGVTVPNFPNHFLVTGPYGFAPGSYLAMVECTARHAVRAIAEARRRGATAVEIREKAHRNYWQSCLRRAARTMWQSPDCVAAGPFYVDHNGDAAALRPSSHMAMWWGNRHFPFRHYDFRVCRARPQ